MWRRGFLGLLGGALAWPLAARAQQGERVRRIGVLMSLPEGDPESRARTRALKEGLEALGWVDGRNIHIDLRFGAGVAGRASSYARELIGAGAELLVANSSPVLSAVQQETRTIPVVFVQVAEPVGGGFVKSLARPGGNTTGFTSVEYAISGKWLELLTEIAPAVRRVAVLRDPSFAAASAQLGVIHALAPLHGLQIVPVGVRDPKDMERALVEFAGKSNGGLVVVPSPQAAIHRKQIVDLAAKHRLPAVYPLRYFVASGGLVSYGISPIDLFRRSAGYVDRILKGEKPENLPVQAPTKFELIVNLKAARASGLQIPATVLARADEVIE